MVHGLIPKSGDVLKIARTLASTDNPNIQCLNQIEQRQPRCFPCRGPDKERATLPLLRDQVAVSAAVDAALDGRSPTAHREAETAKAHRG